MGEERNGNFIEGAHCQHIDSSVNVYLIIIFSVVTVHSVARMGRDYKVIDFFMTKSIHFVEKWQDTYCRVRDQSHQTMK